MKKYKNIFFLAVLFLALFAATGCDEEATLDGAKAVYIEISPKDGYIMVGDTVQLKATVSNISGDIIDTPVSWSVDNESILKLDGNKLIALQGSQGKSTNIRAILKNGKYAISKMTVTNHVADGVGALVDIHYTYKKQNDTIWFIVSPKKLLLDFVPELTISGQSFITPAENPVVIKDETGMVGYVFTSGNTIGNTTITLAIGAEGNQKKASTDVTVCPEIRSSLGNNFNSITYEKSMIMDIHSVDTVWVNTEVTPAYPEDLKNAKPYYVWSSTGTAAQLVKYDALDVAYTGHRAYAVVRSGVFEGETKVKFDCYGTALTTTINVQDYKLRYPVEELKVDKNYLEIPMDAMGIIIPEVIPISSYSIHQPVFKPVTPGIVEIIGYNSNEMQIRGRAIGETDIIVTSNDKSLTIHVKVTDKVQSVTWVSGNQKNIFEGQTTTWGAKVETLSGVAFPVKWTSGDEIVATVAPQDEEYSNLGIIHGIKAGRAKISAEAGGKTAQDAYITVMEVPSEIVYNTDNTKLNGNAVYEDKSRLVISIEPKQPSKYGMIYVYIRNYSKSGDYSGTYTASNLITLDVDGALVEAESGTIIVYGYEKDFTRRIEIKDLKLKVSDSKSFMLQADISAY